MATPLRKLTLESFEQRRLMTATVAELEPNDTHAAATAFDVTAGEATELVGTSANHDDKDFFVFKAAADGVLNAVVSSPNGEFAALEIETAQGQDVLETEPNDGVNVAATRIEAGIKYFVRVRAKDDAPAEYSVALTVGDKLPGDANDDGQCDLSDLNEVRNNFGGHGSGDTNGDDSVDLSDLNEARNHFGQQLDHPVPGGIITEQEVNDSEHSANAFFVAPSADAELVGTSANADDKDYFRFEAPVSGTIYVTVRSTNGNVPGVEVEDSASVQILETEPNDGLNTASGAVVEGQSYFVRVRSKEDSAAAYSVIVSFDGFAPDQPAGEPENLVAETEGNDSKSSANAFALGTDKMVELTGTSTSSDDKDFFKFTAPLTGTIFVSVRSTNGNIPAAEMEDTASVNILETEPNDGVNTASGEVTAGSVYFLRVRATDDAAADYVVKVSYEADNPGGGDPGAEPANLVLEAEPNDDKDFSTPFGLGSDNYVQLTGVSASHDDKDFFKFTAAASGMLQVNVASLSGPLADLEIEFRQDNTLLELEAENGVTSASRQVTAGTEYFVRLRGHDPYYGVGAPSEYLVTLELTPDPAPVSLAPSATPAANDAVFASLANFTPTRATKLGWVRNR